jgi:hypothetical protein
MDVELIPYIHIVHTWCMWGRSVSVTNFFLRAARWSCCEFVLWYCMCACICYCDGK